MCRQSFDVNTEGVAVDDPTDICDYVMSEETSNFVVCLGTMCESVSDRRRLKNNVSNVFFV